MDSRREIDEQEIKRLEEETEKVPRGWRPSQETIRAIQGEVAESDTRKAASSQTRDAGETGDTRLDAAAERLQRTDWLQPDKWAQLDQHEKAAALNAAGRELAEVYDTPSPPLQVEDMRDPTVRGGYGDGYRFNRDTGQVKGADYGIRMNREAEVDYGKLFGDDPAAALRTYAHEFRHSYQAEQATRYEKPQFQNLVDDPEAARVWSENNRNYISPKKDYEAYRGQPVERDARDFADELVRRVYR